MNIAALVKSESNPNVPPLASGDTVKVSARVVEGDRERIQVFQGVVIRVRHGGAGANFTVRRVAHGVGVERTFLIYSPLVEKVEVTRHGKVRRAKLYYLRGRSSRASRIRERRVELKEESQTQEKIQEELVLAAQPEIEGQQEQAQAEGQIEVQQAENLEQQTETEQDEAQPEVVEQPELQEQQQEESLTGEQEEEQK
jgi:large subunit ribosomal protein L19